MPKSKKEQTPPTEDALLKALDELEEVATDTVAKGDAMLDADPEGGLSTEGKPLSAKAPSGKGETAKAMSASSSSSASDSSSEKAPPKKMKKAAKGKKMEKQMAYSMSSSEDSESESAAGRESKDDDESSSPMGKSFRQVADEDETMAKAIEVSEFIEAMVDQLSASHGALTEVVAGLRGHVDDRVAKSQAAQGDFNRRMAHAIVALGKQQGELVELVKSIANQPATASRKTVLSKSEVNNPPFAGGGNGLGGESGAEDYGDLTAVPAEKICDWLFNKAMSNDVPHILISEFEAARYNPAVLPAQVRKALAADLCK